MTNAATGGRSSKATQTTKGMQANFNGKSRPLGMKKSLKTIPATGRGQGDTRSRRYRRGTRMNNRKAQSKFAGDEIKCCQSGDLHRMARACGAHLKFGVAEGHRTQGVGTAAL